MEPTPPPPAIDDPDQLLRLLMPPILRTLTDYPPATRAAAAAGVVALARRLPADLHLGDIVTTGPGVEAWLAGGDRVGDGVEETAERRPITGVGLADLARRQLLDVVASPVALEIERIEAAALVAMIGH